MLNSSIKLLIIYLCSLSGQRCGYPKCMHSKCFISMTLYKRDIIINFNMHKCIQNNNINVNLVSTCLHYCCYCVCFFCHSTDSFCFHMCFEFSIRPSNACCRGFDEFIAVRYSTIRVMTNFQYALNTSFFFSLRSIIF